MIYIVKVLKDGYSYEQNGQYKANGTCTLILGPEVTEPGKSFVCNAREIRSNGFQGIVRRE